MVHLTHSYESKSINDDDDDNDDNDDDDDNDNDNSQHRSQFSALSSSALANACPWTPVILTDYPIKSSSLKCISPVQAKQVIITIIIVTRHPSAGHNHHHHRGQAAECRPSRFRKIDGSCNSLVNSNYGRTGDDRYDYDDIDDHD